MGTLPQEFKERMEHLLGEEYEAFSKSWEGEPAQALRVNTLKIPSEEFLKLAPFSLCQVPWAEDGFYYGKEDRPGKHPYHEAGLYYMQEPSAMAVGSLADARPGERVLDLCAAPGGKTTHLAASMKGEGLLVSNEIHPVRAKILASNVERMGIRNCVVINERPKSLADRFPAYFDRIVVDAPCSGEGMFRKEEEAIRQWSPENVLMCARRQQEILEDACDMLRPGGTLVYSTCTFSPEENEGSIHTFLEGHPDFSVKGVRQRNEDYGKFSQGRPEWVGGGAEIADTCRLWPHKLEGEGHYVAVLEKAGETAPEEKKTATRVRMQSVDRDLWRLYKEFEREFLRCELPGVPVLFGDQLYLLPETFPLKGLKVLRPGLHLGTIKKNRFEPAHALALALKPLEAAACCSMGVPEAEEYLKGAIFEGEGKKGWQLMLVDGYSIGWGKQAGGLVKNHYPKGLRKN